MKITKKSKILIPVIASLAILSLVSFSPISVSAAGVYDLDIPEISGTIEIKDSSDKIYLKQTKISFETAMVIAENSVTDSNAMIGKIEVLQGYLVYKIPVVDDDKITFYTFIDAGNGDVLFVSKGFTEEQIKSRQLSLEETQRQLKESGIEMTIEEIEQQRRNGEELKRAFLALPIEDKATLLSHLAMARLLPDDQQRVEREKLIVFMEEELFTTNHEGKILKLKEFAESLR